MRSRRPTLLVAAAIFQFVPFAILPPSTWRSMGPIVIALVVGLFAFLAVSLLRCRAWSIVASIFVQGMNIIVRLLIAVSHATQGAQPGAPADFWLLGTSVISIALSWLILCEIDQPRIRMLMR